MLRRALSAVDRYWYAPVRPERLALLRILVGSFATVYVAVRYGAFAGVTRLSANDFAPVGPLQFLSAPLPPALVHALLCLTLVAGAGFTLGWRYKATGPLFALLLLVVTTYRSSFGMKFHTENLLVFHVLLLGAAPAADVLGVGARQPSATAHGRYGWPVRAMCAVTVIAYLLAGIAKVKTSSDGWLSGEILRAQVAYDNLRKLELGSIHSPLGAAMVQHAWPFAGLAWLTLVFEIGAPLALLGPRCARIWIAGAWLFHAAVVATMAIVFPYPLSLIGYASFFEVERLQRTRAYAWFGKHVEKLAQVLDRRSILRHR